MAYPGQTISNPLTGEEITFITTAAESEGALLVFDCAVKPGGTPLPVHVHAAQEERFLVIRGTLGVMVGGEERTLTAGERATLPARIKHQWWNAGADTVLFRVEVAPPNKLEIALEAVCGMAQDGKMTKRNMPRNPFHLMNLGKVSETYLPGIPIWLQKSMLNVGSAVGRILGYSPEFPQYTTQPVPEAARRAA